MFEGLRFRHWRTERERDGTVSAPDARHLSALAQANCLIEVPEGVVQLVDGDAVAVHPI